MTSKAELRDLLRGLQEPPQRHPEGRRGFSEGQMNRLLQDHMRCSRAPTRREIRKEKTT